MDKLKIVFRNTWTGAIFIVVGEVAASRMALLPSWVRQ